VLTACSNCLNGGVQPWEYAAAVVGGTAALGAGVLFGRIAVSSVGRRRVAAGLAALGLGLAPLVALALLKSSARPAGAEGNLVCGSALDASRLEGWPTDAALDASQMGCKAAAERRVDQASMIAAGGLVVGLPAGIVAVARRRDPPDSLPHGSTDSIAPTA
jgi:hypothetical protein